MSKICFLHSEHSKIFPRKGFSEANKYDLICYFGAESDIFPVKILCHLPFILFCRNLNFISRSPHGLNASDCEGQVLCFEAGIEKYADH